MAREGGWIDTSIDPDISRMNQKHALVWVKGRSLVATFANEGSISLGQIKDLHAFYENDQVPRPGGGTEAVSRKWSRHPKRRMYPNGLTFEPGLETPGKLNLWSGWKVEPNPAASCGLFLAHLENVVCGGDSASFEYLLGWLAHLIQRPWEIPGVALVLKGEKGVGKDTFVDYLVPLIGRQHVPTVSHQQHVTGRFNARLESALILHLQEGIWGGDKRAEQNLKYLITSGRIEIERKGVASYGSTSCLRLVISSNENWIVPASGDERRFAVFDVSSARKGDKAYFGAIRKELEAGGPAALLHYLQAFDLSDFNVRRAPETKGLLEQKLQSLRGFEKWWHECLCAGEIISLRRLSTDPADEADWESGSFAIPKEDLRMSFGSWLSSRRFDGEPLDAAGFARLLLRMAPSTEEKRPRINGARRRDYVLPPLEVCRSEFETWIGHEIDWG